MHTNDGFQVKFMVKDFRNSEFFHFCSWTQVADTHSQIGHLHTWSTPSSSIISGFFCSLLQISQMHLNYPHSNAPATTYRPELTIQNHTLPKRSLPEPPQPRRPVSHVNEAKVAQHHAAPWVTGTIWSCPNFLSVQAIQAAASQLGKTFHSLSTTQTLGIGWFALTTAQLLAFNGITVLQASFLPLLKYMHALSCNFNSLAFLQLLFQFYLAKIYQAMQITQTKFPV